MSLKESNRIFAVRDGTYGGASRHYYDPSTQEFICFDVDVRVNKTT
jgi:hypothetical protein